MEQTKALVFMEVVVRSNLESVKFELIYFCWVGGEGENNKLVFFFFKELVLITIYGCCN